MSGEQGYKTLVSCFISILLEEFTVMFMIDKSQSTNPGVWKDIFSECILSLQGDTPLAEAAAGKQDSNQDFCTSFLPSWCLQTHSFPSGLSVLVHATPLLSPPPDSEASSCPLEVLTSVFFCSQTCVRRPPCSALLWLAENSARP